MKKLFIYIIATCFYSAAVNAQIFDIPEKVLQIVNKVNEKLVVIEKQVQEYHQLKSQIKTGIVGTETFQMFKDIQMAYNTGKNSINALKEKQRLSVFHGLYNILAEAQVLSYVEIEFNVEEQMTPNVGDGNDSQNLENNRNQNTEIAKNNIASLYARALATRYASQVASQNYKEDDTEFENESELLNAIRAVAQESLKRKSNVLYLESSMLEYYATGAIRRLKPVSIYKQSSTEILSSQEKEEEQDNEN